MFTESPPWLVASVTIEQFKKGKLSSEKRIKQLLSSIELVNLDFHVEFWLEANSMIAETMLNKGIT
jgi:hypothetical protein